MPKVGVLFDNADVELIMDQFGVPFSLKSSIGLPESVVNALQSWRYSPYKKNHGVVPFSVKIHFPVARKITPELEQTLGRFWDPAERGMSDAIERGEALDSVSSVALERKLTDGPETESARISLLAYYARGNNLSARAKLLTWFVQHNPRYGILGSPVALINSSGGSDADAESAAEIGDLWLEAMKQAPQDDQVISHALNYLQVLNGPKAMAILSGSGDKVKRGAEWKGVIYGLGGLGVTALDPASGRAVAASDASAAAPFAVQARENLLASTDSKIILTGMVTLSRAGRSLAATHSLPAAFDGFCARLLALTKTFDPGTTQACDTSITEADDEGVLAYFSPNFKPEKFIRRTSGMVFPRQLNNKSVTGTVSFSMIVSKAGGVTELGFLGGPFLLYHAALAAVKSGKYNPAQINGKAIDVLVFETVTLADN